MSLPINASSLAMELRATLTEVERQIAAAKRVAMQDLPIHLEPADAELYIYRMKYRDGKFILADLLIAKSQLLTAIANLQNQRIKR